MRAQCRLVDVLAAEDQPAIAAVADDVDRVDPALPLQGFGHLRQPIPRRIEHDDDGVLWLALDEFLPVRHARIDEDDFARRGRAGWRACAFARGLRLDRSHALVERQYGGFRTRGRGFDGDRRAFGGDGRTVEHQPRFERQRRRFAAAQRLSRQGGGRLQLG